MGIEHNTEQVIDSLNAALRQATDQVARIVRIVGVETMRQLIGRSPVDTGYYRASHDLTIGIPSEFKQPQNDTIFNRATQGGGIEQQQIAKGTARLSTLRGAQIRKGVSIYITNNAPYATILETGHSQQARQGIYTVVARRVPAILRAATKAVSP